MLISKEGRIFVIPLLIITLLFWFFYISQQINIFYPLLLFVLFIFCLNFFRDPKRPIPKGVNQIVSPADGKIVRLDSIFDDEVGNSIIISIFLNIFNVHVNRMPIDGKFYEIEYNKGRFLLAFQHNASDENEKNIIKLKTKIGTIKIVQIAGLLARRIICYAEKGNSMNIGDRLGFMRFGSRIDLILPDNIKLNVKKGDKVIGNTTIIGTY